MDTPTTPPVKKSGLAIWSLVLGILGLVFLIFCIGPLFAIPAVICGHMAYSRIKRSGGALAGGDFALAGLITGYIGLALGIVLIPVLAAIAIPNFAKARATAQKNVCIRNLTVIDQAKQQWAVEHGKSGDDTPTAQDLDQYIPGGFAHLHCPGYGEYTKGTVSEPATSTIPSHLSSNRRLYVPSTSRPLTRRNLRSANTNTFEFSYPSNDATVNLHFREILQKAQCQSNLRQIESAKRIWALRNHKQPADVPTADDLAPYLPAHQMPVCPGGGTYEIGSVGETSTCSIPDHQIPKSP